MSRTTIETILRLDLIDNTAFAKPLPGAEENDWMENDNLESKTTNAAPAVSGVVHRCDCLRISLAAGGYELKTAQRDILLYEGDIIELPMGSFRVTLEQQHVVPAEVKENTANAVPEYDDIWSTEEVHHSSVYLTDPFANTAQPFKPAVIPPIQNAHLSATTIPDAFSLSQPKPQDPLHFLYESSPREPVQQPQFVTQPTTSLPPYASLLPTNNVSVFPTTQTNSNHDLPINELDKSSYLDQSPMDRLDEYLGVDDDYYPRPQPVAPLSNAGIGEVQNQVLEPKRGFLTSVKQAMKPKK